MPTVISPDSYRYHDGVYRFSSRHEPEVWGAAYLDFAALCDRATWAVVMVGIPGSGKTTWIHENGKGEVFFDATNLTVMHRRPIIALARAMGCTVKGVHLMTPLEICLERNAKRSEDRRVPEDTIRSMEEKMVPPDLNEGFHSTRGFK